MLQRPWLPRFPSLAEYDECSCPVLDFTVRTIPLHTSAASCGIDGNSRNGTCDVMQVCSVRACCRSCRASRRVAAPVFG